MTEVIISDTSCLIAFERIGQLDILRKTFYKVTVTEEVKIEFANPLPKWIDVDTVAKPYSHPLLERLDIGEASSISLAMSTPGSILIIDEKKGRLVAKELGLKILGSLKVLLLAKQTGVISNVKDLIAQLKAENFRFSDKIVEDLLSEAGEN